MCVHLWDSDPATRLQEVLHVAPTLGHGELRLQGQREVSGGQLGRQHQLTNQRHSPQRGTGRGCWGRSAASRDWPGGIAPRHLSGRRPGRSAAPPSAGPRCSGREERVGEQTNHRTVEEEAELLTFLSCSTSAASSPTRGGAAGASSLG